MDMTTFDVNGKQCVALVRKLTPRETFRLMGVSDEDIDKIETSGVSVSGMYKLAGNSIVVDVLYHIFRKAFVERGNDTMQTNIFDACADTDTMQYTHDNPLRVVTLCSGYDSQCLALERLKRDFPPFDYDLVAWSEFDPMSKTPLDRQPAVVAHNALFPQWKDRNLGDMTKIDWEKVPDFDLLFYSTPCQSVSQAGLQHGFTEGSGTRSSIIWNVRDALMIKRPRYACLENVAAMVSAKFKPMYDLWQNEVARLGYTNYSKLLNAKDYGVPQNRERIFLWSVQGDVQYYFPQPMPLTKKLHDVLEEEADLRYYLNPQRVQEFVRDNLDKVQQYAKDGVGDIEPLPDTLREWMNSYEDKKKCITADQ